MYCIIFYVLSLLNILYNWINFFKFSLPKSEKKFGFLTANERSGLRWLLKETSQISHGISALLSAWGWGGLGSSLGEGFTAVKAVEGVTRSPEHAPLITRTMLVGMAVTESVAIYALVVALLLIFVAK